MKRTRVDSRHPLVKQLHKLYRFLFKEQSGSTAANLTFMSLAVLVFILKHEIKYAGNLESPI